MKRGLLAVLVVPFVAACGSAPTVVAARVTPDVGRGKTVTVKVQDRPFQLHVPSGYDPAAKVPLVILLHGFRANGAIQEAYFKLTAESDRHGFLYATPDGTKNRNGDRFWNATAACCDFERTGVDDSAYLHRLIEAVKSQYPVDPKRVYFVGHSNGAFMAYRMACEHSTEITAIVSLAGAADNDASRCTPERPVSILEIHGTSDRTIRYDGGANVGNPYPSVATTLAGWRRHNGCGDRADTSAPPMDLDGGLSGNDTTVTAYVTGCRNATRVELWSIKNGGHIPAFTPNFAPAVVAFLLARTA
jgi:polyhydroxybutyrate depolymerase